MAADLDALYAYSDRFGLLVDELFDLLESSEEMREALTLNEYRRLDQPTFDTVAVGAYCRARYNISRIKFHDRDGRLAPVRLLYAVDHSPHSCRIVFLGLMPRGDNYDVGNPFAQRIFKDYEDFNVPRLGQ